MKIVKLDKHQFDLLFGEDWIVECKENCIGDQFACFSRRKRIPGGYNYFEIQIETTKEDE